MIYIKRSINGKDKHSCAVEDIQVVTELPTIAIIILQDIIGIIFYVPSVY